MTSALRYVKACAWHDIMPFGAQPGTRFEHGLRKQQPDARPAFRPAPITPSRLDMMHTNVSGPCGRARRHIVLLRL